VKPPSPPERDIETVTLHGRRRSFPADQFRVRVSAYGVAVAEGRVLLARSAFTDRWDIPGGGIEPWETIEDGLRREYAEETGVAPEVAALLHFEEGWFSIFDRPFHSLRFYYRVVVPRNVDLAPDTSEVRYLEWVDVGATGPGDFAPGDLAVVRRALEV
jgi:8-oxo-dGTP diphosphatase